MGLLAVIGLCVLSGVLGAWFFQRLHVPQVVGYIVIGVLIGDSGFQWVHQTDVETLRPFNLFALGLIGFLVGGELDRGMFRKYGRQFTIILLGEGLLSFALVAAPCACIVYWMSGDLAVAAAAGAVLGAIASATDPASTIDVLWEYRTAGALTSSIIAIVALDDALAMALYGIGTSVAQMATAHGGSLLAALWRVGIELLGAVGLGFAAGYGLNFILRWLPQKERRLGLALGVILLTISVALTFGLDVILATMSIGIVLTNLAPRRSRELFEMVRAFSAPIYILFFVLVGARLGLRSMPVWIWGIAGTYVVMRSAGKWLGAWVGGTLSQAEPVVRRYLGLSLFAQGGVAVGLSIMASQHLQGIAVTPTMSLGDMIIATVAATTLAVQLLGPACTRWAVRRAGETGRNVTEADVVGRLTVGDVMNPDVQPIPEDLALASVVARFTERDALVYPVVSRDGEILGILTFESLKELLNDPDSWDWLVAGDVMEPVGEQAAVSMNLGEVLEDMNRMQVEALPVIHSAASPSVVGVLDQRFARRRIREELVRLQTAGSAGAMQ